jgi:fatty acid desaturase
MTLFRHPEDRLPVLLFTLLFALDMTIYATATAWWIPPLWMLVGIIPKGWVCAWNHHHQHVPTFRYALPNRMVEFVFGTLTGVTSHAWYLHHVVGHHMNYLDQTKDESRWKRADGSTMGEHEYSFDVAITAYPRAWAVGAHYPKQRRIFLGMGLLQLAFVGTLAWFNWYNALFCVAIPMALSLYLTAWATYFHHVNLDTDVPTEASYNILHRGYNLMTGNLGYHTAHHMKHGLHWSKLPKYHAELAPRIPPWLYREPGIPFVWKDAQKDLVPMPTSEEAAAWRAEANAAR